MKIDLEKVKYPLDYNPYDIDCCGSHPADKLTITEETYPERGITIVVQETRSGLGPEFRIEATGPNGQKSAPLYAYVGDDGELNFYVKVDA